MPKKTIKKKTKEEKDYDNWKSIYDEVKNWTSYKLTKADLKARAKEKKRRAKKITMTVGEFEDKLDEARYEY